MRGWISELLSWRTRHFKRSGFTRPARRPYEHPSVMLGLVDRTIVNVSSSLARVIGH